MRISEFSTIAWCVASVIYSLNARVIVQKPHALVQRREATLSEIMNIIFAKRPGQDTIHKKDLTLPEVTVVGVRGVQEIGLTNLKQQAGYRGTTLDKMAVYIPHPATTTVYTVEAITLQLHRLRSVEEKFEQGELRVGLCEAIDVNHPPGASLLSQNIIIDPKIGHGFREGKQEIKLVTPIELPINGLYVVAEWHYERANEDLVSKKTRSAPLAANLSLTQSYTWTSIGYFKQTWQREGDANSLSQLSPYYRGKIYNALMGVRVKEKE